MSTTVPSIMHFISVNRPIDHQEAQTLCIWLVNNPYYTFYLWTQPSYIQASLIAVAEELEEDPTVTDISIGLPAQEGQFIEFTIENFSTPIRINIYTYTRVPFLNSTDFLFCREMALRHHEAAANILRLWILYQYGGIYFGWTIQPMTNRQPTDVRASGEILFNLILTRESTVANNNIMAAPKESPKVRSMLELIPFRYEEERRPQPIAPPPEPKSIFGKLRKKLKKQRVLPPEPELPSVYDDKVTGTGLIMDFLLLQGIDVNKSVHAVTPPRPPLRNVPDSREERRIHNPRRRVAANYYSVPHFEVVREDEELDTSPPPPPPRTHYTYSFRDRSYFCYTDLERVDESWLNIELNPRNRRR